MDIRNEIKAYIVREGVTMSEVVDRLAYEYDWSSSVPNLSGKLRRGSLRYQEAIELADVLGYDIEDGVLNIYTGSSNNFKDGTITLYVTQYDTMSNIVAITAINLATVTYTK